MFIRGLVDAIDIGNQMENWRPRMHLERVRHPGCGDVDLSGG